MTADVDVVLKIINQGIHGQHLYDQWTDRYNQTGNFTRTT